MIVHHLALPFRLPLRDSFLADWLPARLIGVLSHSGYAAVYIFFAISGFLIAGRVIQRYGRLDAVDLRAFYVQRASRILPLLLAVMLASSLLHWAGVKGFVIAHPEQSLGGAWFAALGLHLNWYEGRTTWLPATWDVLWSLSIEELFYLCFPVLCLALPRSLLVVALAALMVSLPWTRGALDGQAIWQEKAYLPAMSVIAMGVLAALLVHHWRPSHQFARCVLILGLLALAGSLLAPGELWRTLRHGSLLAIAGASVLVLLGARWLAQPVPPGLAWLARMGRLSYELYLTHMFVVLPVVALCVAWAGPRPAWSPLVYPLVVGLCVLLAAKVELHFSKPIERSWRRRWERTS